MIPRASALRLAFFLGWVLLAFAAISRACAVPVGGQRIYLPHADGGPLRACDHRTSPLLCWYATQTRVAAVSPTPTPTFGPWVTSTPPRPALPQVGGPVASVRIDGRACYAAPMADGVYTAGHCLRGARSVSIGGVPARWSVDHTRDLAHIAANADPSVTLRPAEVGEVLRWANARASGAWRVAGVDGGAVVVCAVEGWVMWGDSGTGAYSPDDGALVGVLTNAALSGDWRDSLACSDGAQQGRLEQVP